MKILYHISQLPHYRVFEKLKPISGIEQLIVGPKEVDDVDNYGYNDFGIQNIKTYKGKENINKIISDFEPDIYVNSVLSFFKKSYIMDALQPKCKLAYIHHGFCAKTSVDIYRLHKSVSNRKWMENAKNFSVACGGIKYFYDWTGELGLDRKKISLNCLPQMDLLYDPEYYNSRKEVVMKQAGINKRDSILFFGRLGVGKEFDDTNEEFFDTLIELYNICVKNNMVLFVKPKLYYDQMITHLKSKMKTYCNKRKDILQNIFDDTKRVCFIKTKRHIYQYYFADFVVVNGSTSSEMESVIASKPTITVNVVRNKYVDDIYNLEKYGAVNRVNNLNNLEGAIFSSVSVGVRKKLLCGRDAVIKNYNIDFDGRANERTQNAIVSIF